MREMINNPHMIDVGATYIYPYTTSMASDKGKFSLSKERGVKIEMVKPKRYTKSKKRGR